MPTQEAQQMAFDQGLDLVEIVKNSNPPVCAIMDFGKYRFEQKKKLKEQQKKNKGTELKEVRLRPVSEDHDIEIKINQVKRFLEEKKAVTVNIVFKNREIAVEKEHGRKVLERIIQAVEGISKIENQPRFEGKRLSVRLLPK